MFVITLDQKVSFLLGVYLGLWLSVGELGTDPTPSNTYWIELK